jgi:predicted ATPase/DNA-binding SARP family transcriptional activator
VGVRVLRPETDRDADAAGLARLYVTLLGGFSVQLGRDPVPQAWRLRKSKTLVKLLALADGHLVHRDVLTELLWPGADPVAAANNLHQALHAARRALAAGGQLPPGVLRLTDDIVRLAPGEVVEVDADVFAAAAHRALRTRSAGDYRAALELYPGELLPQDRDAGWARPHRERLAALHDALWAGLAGALLEHGRPEEAVALLEPLAGGRPRDEALHRLLMDALDQAGRRWDALDVYQRLQQVLDDEFSAVPDQATRSLYRRVLSGQAPPGPAVAGNLPAAATSFIGRRREIAELVQLSGRTRLLTLSGPGGVGKTRLGIEVARRVAVPGRAADGGWLVDLSGMRDGRLVPAAAAAALGLALAGGKPATAALVDQLADRALVILLDNCEHLLEPCAGLVHALLAGCPAVTVLATSREPLRLPGEVVWRVPSLGLPDPQAPAGGAGQAPQESVQLFVERARSASPGFRLDAPAAAAVARICWRLDGVPLALELAASRMAHLTPAELADRLDDALAVLATRIRGVPDRQATLAATLDWSHDLLDGDERAVLRRLSVFAGGCTLDAAESVCAGGLAEPVAVVVARLVDKSLVAADTAGDQARFRLLEVIGQYAAGRLVQAGEQASCARAHARWYAARAESLDPDVGSSVVGEPSPWFSAETGNLRVALATCLRDMPERALVMAVASWRSWMARGLHAEGLRWLGQALAACPQPSARRARALFATAVFEIRLGRLWQASTIGAQIASLATELGEPAGLAEALHQQSMLAWVAGDWAAAAELASQASAAAAGFPGVSASHEHLRALLALSRGDTGGAASLLAASLAALAQVPPDALPFFSVCTLAFTVGSAGGLLFPVFEESMLVGRRVGAAQARGYVLASQALAARLAGRFGDAAAALAPALRLFESLGDRAGQAHVLAQQGHLQRERGHHAAARECLRRAADLRAAIPDQRGTAIALAGVALAEAGLGDEQRARALSLEACLMLDRAGDMPGYVGALSNVAAVEVLTGRPGQAIEALERALARRGVPDSHRSVGWQCILLAGLCARAGDRPAAAAALAAAAECFGQIGERRGLAAVAAGQRRLRAARRTRAKPMQSPPP